MSERETVGGIPVECLIGESAAVWSGWRILGDREVVREASAKGTHINLAHKYLAHRRNCSFEQAEGYFNKEVENWVQELLNKYQVYRATHILKNVGKDPVEYICKVCIQCKEPTLRYYLANYVLNTNGFNDKYKEAWLIIESISHYEKKCKHTNFVSNVISIEDVANWSENVKESLCIELYFRTFESYLLKNIRNATVWEYLLLNNEIDIIKYWISRQYCYTDAANVNVIDERLEPLFENLSITSEMIEAIELSETSELTKDLIKSHLCRFGIFSSTEKCDLKLMLARIFSNQLTLKEFERILSYETCNINKSDFIEKINRYLCLTQQNYTEHEHTKVVELYNSLNKMRNTKSDNLDVIIDAVWKNIQYLSDDSIIYLEENYLVTFALIFLQYQKIRNEACDEQDETFEGNKFEDLFTSENDLKVGDDIILYEITKSTLKRIPMLQRIIRNEPKQYDITSYEILNGCKDFNAKRFFKWRFNNETMPHFLNEALAKKYGYKETLTYAYFLKEARPNMAIDILFVTYLFKRGKTIRDISGISYRMKCKAAFYAHSFALMNLDKSDVVCSCISFMEMLGIDSEYLRLHVTAANYVKKELDVSIGNLLESIMFKNQNDLESTMSYLVNSFRSFLDKSLISNVNQFFIALKTWDFIVRFARTHDHFLPDTFLKFLAQRNMWFEFILVGHLFSYPTPQILKIAKEFENSSIREHLLTCLDNLELTNVQASSYYETKIKSRDARQSLYYKIGLKQNASPTISSSSCSSLADTSSSDSHSINSEKTSLNCNVEFSVDDDLWMTILKCHQSQDPPGSLLNVARVTLKPVLVVLATCYEPSSTAAYCYSWMVISTTDDIILSDYAECLEQIMWPANKVLELIPTMVSHGYVNTLTRAFKIFMPENILNLFFEFLSQCINYGEFKKCQKLLVDFKSQCSTLTCSKIVNWECIDDTYLRNLYWIATVATKCVVTTLAYNFQSTQLQIHLLNALVKRNFHAGFPVEMPNFQCLLEVSKVLLKTDVTLDFAAFSIINNVYCYDVEIRRCIEQLTSKEDYANAVEICNIAKMDPSEIILAQYRNEFNYHINTNNKVERSFWKRCADDFKKYNVPPEAAAKFLIEHAEKVLLHNERYEILRFAFETLKDSKTEQRTINTLEMAMWKSCILAGPDNVSLECEEEILQKLKTELLAGLDELQITCMLADETEENAAEILIDKLIDSSKLDIALRISVIFNYKHRDLQVLMLCLSLAEGEILPMELTPQQNSLLAEADKSTKQTYGILKNRGIQRLSSSSSLNTSVAELAKSIDTRSATMKQYQLECIRLLEKLFSTLHHGINAGSRILLCYKLAVELGKSYQAMITLNDPVQLLQEVTERNIENKYHIANEIIVAYKIDNENIASFLTRNIVSSITNAIEDGQDDSINMWGYSLDASFHLVMELCNDVSILGSQLLETVHTLMGKSHGEKRSVSALKVIVELLIRSHYCFTACCNMEGIAAVLRKCQNLANTLQNRKHWTLLVRLVTGVGRFTEMNYVFQILKENDQFEYLLKKGLHKVPGLKMALLEFLKRNCPENKDLFTLVALHFQLYYEIALMWENEAKQLMKELISEAMKESGRGMTSPQTELKLIKNEYLQKRLQLIVTNFTHATQYYLQDNKLHCANRCCQQAQLVALQISLFAAVSQNQHVVCILNLKSDEIDKVLCESLTFLQAHIVTRAYNHHADWANVIYNHYILNGENKYLKDFVIVNKLSSHLVRDCVRRYRSEKSITPSMTSNMKTLISELADVECKYMLASQLGFKEIVETMLNTPAIAAYLRDTIWKTGYKTV